MKRTISIFLLILLGFSIYLIPFAFAAIETPTYGFSLGKYDSATGSYHKGASKAIYGSKQYWTVGPVSIFMNSFSGERAGSVIGFSDVTKVADNGYLMVGKDKVDSWISYFKGNPNFVKSNLDWWNGVKNPSNQSYNFANLAQIAELSGGSGDTDKMDIKNQRAIFYRTEPPYTTLTADKTSIKAGETVTFSLKAQTNTVWGKYIDISFAGAGQTYISDQRYNEVHPTITYKVTLSKPGTYLFRLTGRDSAWRSTAKELYVAVGDSAPPPAPPPPPTEPPPGGGGGEPPPEPVNEPPVARFSWPASTYEGEPVNVSEDSFDRDGQVVDWYWTFSTNNGVTQNLKQGGGTVTFANSGNYNLTLKVTDDKGATDSVTKSIVVKKPIPTAVINNYGTLKENRKVVLDSLKSFSPSLYPIDHSLDEWTITPVSGGSDADIKYGNRDGAIQEVLFKKAGVYKVGLRVKNAKYSSEWVYKDITIAPDDPPVANFLVASITFRNPADQSYASIKLTDRSSSLDGDIISQRFWKYKFDSDNDGSFLDESWVVLDSGNNVSPVLRTNKVGKYLFSLEVKESFGQETIPQFITDADYRRGDTSLKPDTEKITDVKNIAPTTSFSASIKNKVDIVFDVGDVSPNKLTDLDGKINNFILSKLLSKNVDVKTNILNSYTSSQNILQDPSLEMYYKTTWGQHPGAALNTGATVALDSTIKRSGNTSIRAGDGLNGSKWSAGVSQLLSGWSPGDTLLISAYLYIPYYSRGTAQIDLYGLDSGGAVVFDTDGQSTLVSKSTSGFVELSGVYKVPLNVKTLYFRIFADNYPIMNFYMDDAFVGKVTYKSLDTVLSDISWRDNSTRFFVNLSDGQIPGLGNGVPEITTNYSNMISVESSFSGNYGTTGGNKADGGSIVGGSYYWFAQNRYIDIGKNISKSDIKSIIFSGVTGGGDTTYLPIEFFVSDNGTNWYSVGTIMANNSNYQSPLTVSGTVIPISNIRYLRGYNPSCFDDMWVQVNLGDPYGDKSSLILDKLNDNGIDFDVLGTDVNKSQAENIISKNSGKGVFYYNNNMDLALDNLGNYMLGKLPPPGPSVSYILLGEELGYQPFYTDYEIDPKFVDNWYYSHDPNFLDNNSGNSFYHQKTLTNPVNILDKVGKYDIQYKAMDDPTQGDARFNNYRLWSDPAPTSIIVHRKPIADFTNQDGTLNITDLSYDLDFQFKRPDRGIVEHYWKWRKTTDTTWTVGEPSGIPSVGDYVIYLKVKDNYGVWSDPVEKTVTIKEINRPPAVNFNWTPTVIFEGDDVTLHNLSTDPDGDPMTFQWTIFNPKGVTTTINRSDKSNVIINNALPGSYWVTLRAWDSKGFTNAVTKSFVVGNLGITGHVRHTDQWNSNRIDYNQSISGMNDSPRGYDVFWAGEKFVLTADTTDTGSSTTKAQTVTATLLEEGITSTLSGNSDKTNWSGEMWEEWFEELPDGYYTFRFTVTYSNGVVKTDDVTIKISGNWQEYYEFHRNY